MLLTTGTLFTYSPMILSTTTLLSLHYNRKQKAVIISLTKDLIEKYKIVIDDKKVLQTFMDYDDRILFSVVLSDY